MADPTVNTSEADAASTAPMFEHYVFSRKEVDDALLPGRSVLQFVNLTHDIAAGAEVVVELLEWDDEREGFNEQRLLSANDRSKLRRLTSASLGLLLEQCYRMRDWSYETHTEQGRKDARDYALTKVARHDLPASRSTGKTEQKAKAANV